MKKMENFCVDCEVCVRCHNYQDKEITYCDCCEEQILEDYYNLDSDDFCHCCAVQWVIDTQYNIIDVDDEDEIEEFLKDYLIKEGD